MTYISEILNSCAAEQFDADKLWIGFEIFVSVFEAFVIIYFVCGIFEHNFFSKKGMIVYIFGSAGYALLGLAINSVFSYEGLADFSVTGYTNYEDAYANTVGSSKDLEFEKIG